jgi:hypothetical protein
MKRIESIVAKRAKTAKILYNAWMYLFQEGYREDVAVIVALELLMEAERRVRNGFSPVPVQDTENLLAVEHKYRAAQIEKV